MVELLVSPPLPIDAVVGKHEGYSTDLYRGGAVGQSGGAEVSLHSCQLIVQSVLSQNRSLALSAAHQS